MKIKEFQTSSAARLFEFWQEIGKKIPYFFPVSFDQWQVCLIADELEGERIFKELKTFYASEGDQVLGFVQFGQPNYAWDEKGQKYTDPDIGVIRHLYYQQDQPDIGEALLQKACDYLALFQMKHAFYHILH